MATPASVRSETVRSRLPVRGIRLQNYVELSIVVVNYRSWTYLETALESLGPDFPSDWEIIVVDNETEPLRFGEFESRFGWAKFVANPCNSGFGLGCNLGVAESSGEELLFMNPDVIAKCTDIRALLDEKKRHPDVSLLSPKQIDLDGRPQKAFDDFPGLLNESGTLKALQRLLIPSRFPDPRAEYDSLTYCDWISGSFLLISREDFDAIGGWSEDFWMYVEDVDLCRRAHDKGMRVAYTPRVQVVHAHGGSSRLNVDVKSMTKLEVIISRHVYVQNHNFGLKRKLTHSLIVATRLPALLLAAVLDLLTLGRIPAFRIRRRILTGLMRYCVGVVRTGVWLSPRALANQSLGD